MAGKKRPGKRKERRTVKRGFTLIELLIVVAIISILAAIALPNFLYAQIRAKVSRAQSDMRTIGQALEMYYVDHNQYPISLAAPGLRSLTDPVAYLTSIPEDVFSLRGRSYRYGGAPPARPHRWILVSQGPDQQVHTRSLYMYPGINSPYINDPDNTFPLIIYDPTNGITSRGDIIRASDYTGNS